MYEVKLKRTDGSSRCITLRFEYWIDAQNFIKNALDNTTDGLEISIREIKFDKLFTHHVDSPDLDGQLSWEELDTDFNN